MRKTTIELLIVGFLGCLLALLAVREHFGYQIDPLIMIALFFAGTLVLIALVRHPAAFIIPVLFIPRLQSISIFNRFEITKGITWLALAIILLSVAISLRFINMGLQESAPVASTPNYGNVLFA